MIDIRPADFSIDLPTVRELFGEYAAGLGIDLAFQNFDTEMKSLPGKYAPPKGRVLLAWSNSHPVGCVGLRPIDDTRCEMKRLYVRPEMRSLQLGRRLTEDICNEARSIGYRQICLDTLPTMTSAIRLYTALGFQPIAPYVFNPIEGAIFLGRTL
jgi:ribosomal protein S18 acetylase RimI-like enzyme